MDNLLEIHHLFYFKLYPIAGCMYLLYYLSLLLPILILVSKPSADSFAIVKEYLNSFRESLSILIAISEEKRALVWSDKEPRFVVLAIQKQEGHWRLLVQ